MKTQFARQTWSFDSNYTRVEALDDEGRSLGYVYFVPRSHRRPRAAADTSLLSVFPEVCRQLVLNLLGRAFAA